MEELHMLLSSQLLPEYIELRANPDEFSNRRDILLHLNPSNLSLASRLGEGPNKDIDQCRLTCSVLTEEGYYFTLGELSSHSS